MEDMVEDGESDAGTTTAMRIDHPLYSTSLVTREPRVWGPQDQISRTDTYIGLFRTAKTTWGPPGATWDQ
jgi:hypothetical protein